jgi:predicted adenine nucleotide alpha hydrolase (AANH) superfamily ATPase
LKTEDWGEVFGYFYGSNVHPEEEYRRRAEALDFLSEHEGVDVFMRPYDPEEWLARVSPLADEPERGARCAVCFALQLVAAAEEGRRHGSTHLATTLSISPHKDVALISRLGREAAASFGLIWEDRIWRKGGGFLRSVQISGELGLYRQNYCGCVYSRNIIFKSEGIRCSNTMG